MLGWPTIEHFSLTYMAEALGAENTSKSTFVKGVGHFKAKYWVEGYVYPANICTPLDRGTVLLQLCCWKFSHKETL